MTTMPFIDRIKRRIIIQPPHTPQTAPIHQHTIPRPVSSPSPRPHVRVRVRVRVRIAHCISLCHIYTLSQSHIIIPTFYFFSLFSHLLYLLYLCPSSPHTPSSIYFKPFYLIFPISYIPHRPSLPHSHTLPISISMLPASFLRF